MRTSLVVPFVDARARDLVLTIEPTPRPSLARLDKHYEAGRIELHVLGASHQVVLDLDGNRLIEVVACDSASDGERLPATAELTIHGLAHRFSGRTDCCAANEFTARVRALEHRLARDPDALLAVFPGRDTAITALRLERAGTDAVAWRTWHAYPQWHEIVTTTTEVRPR